MQDFRKLQIWDRAHQLTLKVYLITKDFPQEEKFGLTNQLRRAISSVPANIAEGAGRNSNKDFAQFLNIAVGSLNEANYYLLLAKELNFISDENYKTLDNECNEIKAMLISLINKIRIST